MTLVNAVIWLALLAGISAAGLKYVAVVETDVDAASGVSALLNSADVRQVTAELRREAVKNLPAGQYNIMTSETVYSQGGAVLEECADENCVIVLGSKIGADFIVRGTISKLQTKFTLLVEMYETTDGNLVAQSDPVRCENIEELIEEAGAASAEMYKTFANTQSALQKQKAAAADAAVPPPENGQAEKRDAYAHPKPPKPERGERSRLRLGIGAGAALDSDFGGGLEWKSSGEALGMPYYGGGAYLFFDAVYAEAFAGFSSGTGKWDSPASKLPDSLTDMQRSYINIGAFAKYPFAVGSAKLFPLIGIGYEASISGKRVYADGTKVELNGSTSAAWLKLGAGADLNLGDNAYIRVELLYGRRTANEYENKMRDQYIEYYPEDANDVKTRQGDGLSLKAGVGIKI
jgi:hypothetical protein